ncbi:LysE family translocator [Kiloniella sp.]|uniref:LysE family translocator n=1 Tax=Kiloniella sp. TaxID=1938587 RepID=UPI003B020D99
MWSLLVLIVPLAFSLTISPGPNNVMAMASGTNFGYFRSLPVISGFALGLGSMILSAGLGLGQIFVAFPLVHEVLKYVAVAYLLYLAWRIAGSGGVKETNAEQKPLSFMQGILFQWVNPKAWMVSISAVASFSLPEADPLTQSLLIALVFTLVAFPSVSIWAIVGRIIAKYLQSPKALRIFNISIAGLLVLSLIFLFT